jgi:hypothetical protein
MTMRFHGWMVLVGIAALGLAGCDKRKVCQGSDCELTDCAAIEAAFDQVIADHQGCEVDDDCAPVGGTGSCECSPFLGAPDGVAVHVSAAGEAGDLAHKYLARSCGADRQACDAGGIARVACQNGLCAAVETRSCASSADGGDGG